jgi:hypothetical protein
MTGRRFLLNVTIHVSPRRHHPSLTGNCVMPETQQSTRADQNVSVSSVGVREE